MSILSTSSRLIKVGQEYSAGSGISIDDYIISVTGEFGKTYSAGDNIDIYEQDEQLYISSKDWSQDIADASANAYNAATAEIPVPFDPSYISGQIDNKLDTTAFTAWQSGQYATDLQTIEGQINNKLDTSSFSDVSGSFLTAINIPESATWNEVSQAYEQASGTYLTSVSIPESATWQDVSTTVQSNSAQWDDNTGDEEVNSFVYDNSATINDVNTSYQTNSGNFLTAVPADMATTGDVADLAHSVSETYQVKGDYLTTADSDNFYPSNNPSGFITGVDLSPYATTAEVDTLSSILSGAIDYVSANFSSTVLSGDAQGAVNTVYNISGSIISGTRSNKNFTATNVDNITINNTTIGKNNVITTDHAGYPQHNWSIGNDYVHIGPEFKPDYWSQYQRVYLDKTGLSSMSGTNNDKKLIWKSILNTDIEGIDNTITAINGSAIAAGDEFPASANEAITAYQTNSGNYLTAISIPESATWNDVSTAYQNNSATYLTSHQDLSDYQTTAGMTAYQEAGDYYSASNPSGFITGIPSQFSAEKITIKTSDYDTIWIELDEYGQIRIKNTVMGEDQTIDWFTVYGWNNIKNRVDAEGSDWNDATYIVQTNSASWNDVSSKLDTTSFSNVSGSFLTAVDLTPYATTNDLEQVSGDITALIPSTAGLASESYVQTNSAVLTGMIDAKQDTLTFGYDGQDKISAINNSALAGGAAFDVFPISGTGAVDVYEQNSALWISGKDFTSDISYISGTIGDVETLLASL